MSKSRRIDMVILGLLAHEDMTGYDIKKRIDNEISFFWKGSFGSIYPALSELLKAGQIEKIGEAATGGREKILYRVTEEGRTALKIWLEDTRAVNDLKYETLVKLFFGGSAGREVALRNIESFEKQIRRDLATLKMYQGNLEPVLGEEDHLYFYLTVLFGIETYEAYLRWCTKARNMLQMDAAHPKEAEK
ncbi:MAG: PadR family transcriptional regulator [Clostridia bacterium]|nr:PadR family transcriptional regulator [Clostridia bacterium]